ncbi:MAG: alpha/beta hydrolase [Clostridia bacterium]|nr:alpha/beta hydrolase [Clostridia bacterium]
MSKKCSAIKLLGTLGLMGFAAGVDYVFANNLYFRLFSKKSPWKKDVFDESGMPEGSILRESENVFMMSEDGLLLHAYFTPALNHKYAICVHGNGRNLTHMTDRAMGFVNMGYNVLSIELRAYGQSEGENFGAGYPDRRDLVCWCKWISEKDPDAEIVIYGVSMGGATVMMASGERDIPSNVKCAVEDCGYTSFFDQLAYMFKGKNIPPFPVLNTVDALCKKRLGFSLRENTSVQQLKKATLPMLFIHGEKDTFVPFYMLDEEFNACASSEKEKFVVPESGHGESHLVNPELYWGTISEFVNKYIN